MIANHNFSLPKNAKVRGNNHTKQLSSIYAREREESIGAALLEIEKDLEGGNIGTGIGGGGPGREVQMGEVGEREEDGEEEEGEEEDAQKEDA